MKSDLHEHERRNAVGRQLMTFGKIQFLGRVPSSQQENKAEGTSRVSPGRDRWLYNTPPQRELKNFC